MNKNISYSNDLIVIKVIDAKTLKDQLNKIRFISLLVARFSLTLRNAFQPLSGWE